MSIGDIITLISLGIALLALLPYNYQSHLELKFSRFDYGVLILIFIIISMPIVLTSGCPSDSGFPCYLNNPLFKVVIPFVLSISIILFILYKVLWCFFPENKIDKVVIYYKKLIEKNDVSFLLDLIEKYHIHDIMNLFKTDILSSKIFSKKKEIRIKFAERVLNEIINNPSFIHQAAVLRPHLFARILWVSTNNGRYRIQKENVNLFFTELIQHNNTLLFNEIRTLVYNGSLEAIMEPIFSNSMLWHQHQLWNPFGEAAIDEIQVEGFSGEMSRMLMPSNLRRKDILWDFKTYVSIQVLYHFANEAIVQGTKDLGIYYYRHFGDLMIKALNKVSPSDGEFLSIYHECLDQMVDKCIKLIDQCNRYNSGHYRHYIGILSQLLQLICPCLYYREKQKTDYFETIIRQYFGFEVNSESEGLKGQIRHMLRNTSSIQVFFPYFLGAFERLRFDMELDYTEDFILFDREIREAYNHY